MWGRRFRLPTPTIQRLHDHRWASRPVRAPLESYMVLMRMYLLMSGRLTITPVTTTATAKRPNTFDMLINVPL
jgi:hypothetical protein